MPLRDIHNSYVDTPTLLRKTDVDEDSGILVYIILYVNINETNRIVNFFYQEKRGAKHKIEYPGVTSYIRGKDGIITQSYYKIVPAIFFGCLVACCLPYYLWKHKGEKTMKPLIECADEQERVELFLTTARSNETFVSYLILYKIFSILLLIGQWFILSNVFGPGFKYYGVELFSTKMSEVNPWPHPMDVTFPKVAKCTKTHHGESGDLEFEDAICLLPMNNINRYTFCIYWFWLLLSLLIQIKFLIKTLIYVIPCFRKRKLYSLLYSKFGNRVFVNGEIETTFNECKVIFNVKFGDYIVLQYIRNNLEKLVFTNFVGGLIANRNNIIELQQKLPPPEVINFVLV